jgi:hypothetical protein
MCFKLENTVATKECDLEVKVLGWYEKQPGL